MQRNSKMPRTRHRPLSKWLCHGPRRYNSFSTTVPHKLVPSEKSSIQKNLTLSNDACQSTLSGRVSRHWADKKFVSEPRHCNDLPTVAGVPVEYGKCVPAKYSVQKPSSTVLLRNKFKCLQDLSDSQDNGINTVKLLKSGQYQKILESDARKGRDFQYFLLYATFEEFGCCKPHSISYLMPGSKIYDTLSPTSVTSLFTGIN